MAIGSAVFIAGAYTITWNSLAIGICLGDEQSPLLEYTNLQKPIDNTDRYGRSIVETIYTGGNWFAQYTALEYKAGPLAVAFPFGASAAGVMGTIARLGSDIAQSLVFTSTAGTPAASTPTTITAAKALLAPNWNVRLLYGPTLRMVPIRQVLLPYDSGGTIYWATST